MCTQLGNWASSPLHVGGPPCHMVPHLRNRQPVLMFHCEVAINPSPKGKKKTTTTRVAFVVENQRRGRRDRNPIPEQRWQSKGEQRGGKPSYQFDKFNERWCPTTDDNCANSICRFSNGRLNLERGREAHTDQSRKK